MLIITQDIDWKFDTNPFQSRIYGCVAGVFRVFGAVLVAPYIFKRHFAPAANFAEENLRKNNRT